MQTIEVPTEYRKLFDNDWREAAIYGGRYSLKSHTVARFLLIRARQQKTRVLCAREFQNSIADSSFQLLKDLIDKYEMRDFVCTNNSIVNSINGSDFLFKGLWNNEQSIKSIEGIDIAWVEEAQTISAKSLDVLTPTVRKPGSKIIYTYNRLMEDDPVHQRLVIEGRPNTLVIHANYDIAIKYQMIPEVIINEIEDDKEKRPSLYKHKWLGEPNGLELKIYKDWAELEAIPPEARLVRKWLDFGYTNDPTAMGDIYKWRDSYILDETVYRKGMLNGAIATILMNQPDPTIMVIADSSEPKSIDEISLYGVPIFPAVKGPGSINTGIQFVQQQRIYVTKRSTNIWKEYKHYFWKQDKNGKILNDPEGGLDHHMDGIRYALNSILAPATYTREATITYNDY
jgi:phage terminase large subunit